MRFIVVATLVVAFFTTSVQAQVIEWRVENRFRLWDRARVDEGVVSLDTLLQQVRTAHDATGVEVAMRRFLVTQPDLIHKSYWRPDLETYDWEYIWPTRYEVRLDALKMDGDCAWSTSTGALSETAAPCGKSIGIVLPARPGGGGAITATVKVTNGSVTLQTEIVVADRLIASIGDSFASGEGNPDQPMDLMRLPREFSTSEDCNRADPRARNWVRNRFVCWDADWQDRWVGRRPVMSAGGGAQWWDPRCHRSFYSQHMVAALRYAATHPHEATTFITYACSGAETFQGLLTRQTTPPGFKESVALRRLYYPQVEILTANLCPIRSGNATQTGPVAAYANLGRPLSDHTLQCLAGGQPRHIDAVLVSDGGNDIGFGPVIQDALLPQLTDVDGLGRLVLRRLRSGGALPPTEAKARIETHLPNHYAQLRGRLRAVLPEGTPILQNVYPSPLRGEDGELCGGAEDAIALRAIGGFWPDRHLSRDDRWQMHISVDEARTAEELVVRPLNAAIRAHVIAGQNEGWRLVDGFEPAFARRGWCAIAAADTPLGMPNWSAGDASWNAWTPQNWAPYHQRARLFRTPNDAAMTQQPVRTRRLLAWLAPFGNGRIDQQQESLLSAMSGSFHPTFEGHAIMGWSMAETLDAALSPPVETDVVQAAPAAKAGPQPLRP